MAAFHYCRLLWRVWWAPRAEAVASLLLVQLLVFADRGKADKHLKMVLIGIYFVSTGTGTGSSVDPCRGRTVGTSTQGRTLSSPLVDHTFKVWSSDHALLASSAVLYMARTA